MKVILAGYNIDSDVIEALKRNSQPRQDVTPETLSASYARISRDSRPVNELRAIARAEVDKARRSNRNIIFKMGHHSVAEHAVFNFDIIGLSRLATEELEKFRLSSFTEKSQRYITLGDDYLIPEEVRKVGKEDIFCQMIEAQNELYHRFHQRLHSHFFAKFKELASEPKAHSKLDGWAKEDARYIVSLATLGQLGMTVNARNLEFIIRHLAARKLAELQELTNQLYSAAKKIAPSIILFTDPSDFDTKVYAELRKRAKPWLKSSTNSNYKVQLVDFTPEADTKLIASLFHTSSSLSYNQCLEKARELSFEQKKNYLMTAFKYMEFYDAVLREFEYVDLTFDLVVSASCYAQLKRHRLTTQTVQNYNPHLGVTVPVSIEDIGAKSEFMAMIEKTNQAYFDFKKKLESGAEYILTNAHRRRLLLKVNARELYHISRLREDTSAQWEIRALVSKMSQLAKQTMPLTFLLLGGKDYYPEIYKKLFGQPPQKLLPKLQT